MALSRVAELVQRAASDSGVLQALRSNPTQLAAMLKLSQPQVDALKSADLLVGKALVQAQPNAAATTRQQSVFLGSRAGTLLPPFGSGTFPNAAGGFVPVGPPSPPIISVPLPAPSPPTAPVAPLPSSPAPPPNPPVPPGQAAPAPTSAVPQPPALRIPPISSRPPQPPSSVPGATTYPPPATLATATRQGQCACGAPIVAICSVLSQTAITSITAIAAIVASTCRQDP